MDTPPEKRLYSFDEVVMMLDGWTEDWHEIEGMSNADAVRGWVEHMDDGDLPVGIPATDLPKTYREQATLERSEGNEESAETYETAADIAEWETE